MNYLLLLSALLIIFLLLLILLSCNNQLESFVNLDLDAAQYFSEELHKTYETSNSTKNTIFVSVASYRDTECMKTVVDLFEKAKHPDNITVGICQQNKDESETCIPDNFKYMDQLRIEKYDYQEALGPTYARYICSHLWDGEEFFLQIDSHSRFVPDWDQKLLDMYKLCPSDKAILTHYPPAHGQYDSIISNKATPTYTCSAHFENNFHIISEARHIGKQKDRSKPFRTPYASAGLLFGRSDFLHEVPFDPYLPYLFQGEEILLSARLWTNGWDLFNLNDSVITHYYNREKDNQPHFWDDHGHKSWNKIQKESNKRYYYILDQLGESDLDPMFLTHVSDYGIGNQRTLKSWFDFTGIDIENKTVESRCSQTYNEDTQKWEDN